jgi:Protein of unknown function (DUF2795)
LTENSLPSPAVLQRYLHGVDYPATKDQLVAHVRSQCEQATGDAQSECERVIGTLTRLPDQQYSRPTDVSKAFGEIARETLRGADYPASRDDLVAYARDQDAASPVIEALLRIPDQDYDDPDAVIIEIIKA